MPNHRLTDGHERGAEPIAILGMGCRFPGGVTSPDDLWQLLIEERDANSEFPTDRGWDLDALFGPDPDAPGATYVRAGSFLTDVVISTRRSSGSVRAKPQAIDPQQRLLLEATWEALERSSIDPNSLHGSDTGVFFGVGGQEYGPRIYDETEGFAGYLATGTTTGVASGRVAYTLGLQGPAVTVDTSCSSSLVAVHLACDRCGRPNVAWRWPAGPPWCAHRASSRPRTAWRAGRRRPMQAVRRGGGRVRRRRGRWCAGPGPLSCARSLGYPVIALIRGSAVGQDGASDGLSAPSGPAQQRVIRRALADAGLGAGDVDVVEAHGTGTKVGDPIEAERLQATYGKAHSAARPLLVGSVKSNIGHSQYARRRRRDDQDRGVDSARGGARDVASGFAYTSSGLVVRNDRGGR